MGMECSCGKKNEEINNCTTCRPKLVGPVIVGWQKCPVCEGSGYVFPIITTGSGMEHCTICNAEKIINTETGLPPSKHIKNTKQ